MTATEKYIKIQKSLTEQVKSLEEQISNNKKQLRNFEIATCDTEDLITRSLHTHRNNPFEIIFIVLILAGLFINTL